jgi:hypothetical protein
MNKPFKILLSLIVAGLLSGFTTLILTLSSIFIFNKLGCSPKLINDLSSTCRLSGTVTAFIPTILFWIILIVFFVFVYKKLR